MASKYGQKRYAKNIDEIDVYWCKICLQMQMLVILIPLFNFTNILQVGFVPVYSLDKKLQNQTVEKAISEIRHYRQKDEISFVRELLG